MGAITSHYNLAIIIQEQRRGNAVRDLKQDVELLNQRLDKHGVVAGQAATKTEQFVTKTKKLGDAIRRVLVPALLLAATTAVKFGMDSFKAFAQFDKGMAEVFTLLPQRTQELERSLTNGIRSVGREFGYLTEETVPALYQALSAGVDENNAIEAVELAAKAAKAGASDLESTMRIGMAVVNAYGGEIYNLEEAYDLIFQLVDKGVPRMSDWANSLQDVISIASEARTPFEDVVAALAVMTRQGDSAAEAAELLGFILMQMQIEGTTAARVFMEATGQSYRAWIQSGKGLVEGLQMLNQYAIDTGDNLDSMIGGSSNFYRDQQAARGTMELTGLHMQELIDLAAEVGDEMEGSMEKAYGTASDNAQQSLDVMAAKWETIKLKIGEAIWQQEIFLGMTGEEVLDSVETVLDAASGELGQEILDQVEEVINKEEITRDQLKAAAVAFVNEDRSIKIGGLTIFEAFNVEAEAGQERFLQALAGYYNNYKDFRNDMQEAGLIDKFLFEDEFEKHYESGSPGTDFQSNREARAKYNAEVDRQAQELYNNEVYRVMSLMELEEDANVAIRAWDLEHEQGIQSQISLISDYYDLSSAQSSIYDDQAQSLQTQLGYWEAMGVPVEQMGQVVHWMAIDSQVLGKEALAFMDTITKQGIELTDAYADLQAASGEWSTILKDSSGEISLIMGDLAADLTDEERDVMQNILRSVEEGGPEWISAWRSLQSDLTETQRNGLIARLADLQASQGSYQGVYSGDREAAEEAAKRIIAAFEAIDEAYYLMGENMVTNKILTDIRLTDTVAGQQAALEWQVALGNIDEEIAEPMRKELEAAAKLEPILDEMYTAYMADGVLAKQEAENMALAIEAVHTQSKNLTEKGLKAYLDKALSETGGYPYVATVLYDEVNPALDDTLSKTKALTEKPIVPKVKLNKTSFDTLYNEMMDQIKAATENPWTVQFTASYDNSAAPTPNDEQATGTGGSYRTVPSGFPNDSYLVGLTSGEQYAVLTPGQASRGMGGVQNRTYIDQSKTIINNHTAAAAAVSRAYLDTLYDQRIRRFAGE